MAHNGYVRISAGPLVGALLLDPAGGTLKGAQSQGEGRRSEGIKGVRAAAAGQDHKATASAYRRGPCYASKKLSKQMNMDDRPESGDASLERATRRVYSRSLFRGQRLRCRFSQTTVSRAEGGRRFGSAGK